MEHEFSFGTFHQEKQDCLFRRFLDPGNFPLKRAENSSVPFTFKRNFSETFCKWLVGINQQAIAHISRNFDQKSTDHFEIDLWTDMLSKLLLTMAHIGEDL